MNRFRQRFAAYRPYCRQGTSHTHLTPQAPPLTHPSHFYSPRRLRARFMPEEPRVAKLRMHPPRSKRSVLAFGWRARRSRHPRRPAQGLARQWNRACFIRRSARDASQRKATRLAQRNTTERNATHTGHRAPGTGHRASGTKHPAPGTGRPSKRIQTLFQHPPTPSCKH